MRKPGEKRFIVLVALVSLVLTGLTVYAVWQQGQALHERELADLRNAAHRAVTQLRTAYESETQRALDAASRAWRFGGADELNAWATEQREWPLVLVTDDRGQRLIFPLTPLQYAPPGPMDEAAAPELSPAASAPAGDTPHTASAPSEDAGTRGRGLLAVAAVQQNIGRRRDAAQTYLEAARLLTGVPRFARLAFYADRAAVDCLIAEGDVAEAAGALGAWIDRALAGSPSGWGADEIAEIRARARALALRTELLEQRAGLDRLESRARARDDLIARLAQADRATTQTVGASPEAPDREADPIVTPARALPSGATIRLAARGTDLLQQFATRLTPDPRWTWRAPPLQPDDLPLAELPEEFGRRQIVASDDARRRLDEQARRRTMLLGLTAAGSIGAWALVIWLMIRAVNRQRELIQLQRRFVADVSHELKTPLALIRLSADTLRERRVRDPERWQAYLDTITRESERLTSLIDTILDFSRIESGRQELRFRECDVGEVARQAWRLFEPQFVAERFEARLEIAPDLPMIRGDAQALQQVLVNLLQNAVRYAGDRRFVRLGMKREGYLVVIAVEDHGIGMSQQQLDRLGDSFFRGDDTRVRQTRGTGLGLAIVSHIVTAHGGKVEVHSRPGQGSTFTVWLPFEPTQGPVSTEGGDS